MSFRTKKRLIYMTFAIFWFFVNLLTLKSFPLMHSDEAWLAGLTQSMMKKGSLLITEPFFNLAPRAPHTLKTLFHLLQMPFIKLLGYDLFSVRLLSLLAAMGIVLALLYYFDKKQLPTSLVLMFTAMMTLNSQFVYAAHFARQEILLTLVLAVSYIIYQHSDRMTSARTLIISGIIGISISLHPNAFIVAVMIGCLYLLDWMRRKISLWMLLLYTVPMGFLATLNLLVTFAATPEFIDNYWLYASTLSVGAEPVSRFVNFQNFYIKLYHQISGTYFLPDIRFLSVVSLLSSLGLLAWLMLIKKNTTKAQPLWQCLIMLLGFNISIFLIGRFNPTSIIFLTFLLTLLFVEAMAAIGKATVKLSLMTVMLVLLLATSYNDYTLFEHHDYDAYSHFLTDNLSSEDLILGNLSGGFSMDTEQFLDIRNLGYLNDMTFDDYVIRHKINTIIYYEEYDYIHRNPQWQILYGSDAEYYEPLNTLLTDHGTLRAETTSSYYGNRIIRYMGDYPWRIAIYDIDFSAIDERPVVP